MYKDRLWLAVGLMLYSVPLHAGDPEPLQAGIQLLEKRAYPQAIVAFTRVLHTAHLNPDQRVAALSGRCEAYYQQHLGEKNPQRATGARRAIADCSQAIALRSDHAPAYRLRGMTYLTIEQSAQALADLNIAIALDAKDYLALQSRGVAKTKLDQLEAALVDLNAAIQINPDHPGSYYYRGQLYAVQQRHDQAVADFSTFLHITQRDEATYQQAERNRIPTGKEPLSKADFQKAMALNAASHAAQAHPETVPAPAASRPVDEPPAEGVQEVVSAVIVDAAVDAPVEQKPAKHKERVKTAPVKGKWAFRVESFRDAVNADKVLAQARQWNLPVYAETVDVNGVAYIRVWVGPFSQDAEAEKARRKMMTVGYHPGPVSRF
ncbi:MAG: SPOR domain-containing protein [Magnetococcales bacterium]|nr:SPOR domain-containing protein [Magnetococcales bacterium]